MAGASSAADTVPGLRLPPGFEVREFAGDDLAHDIFTMTLDPRGRIVVAGRSYIRLLLDDDGDGRADRSVQIADHPTSRCEKGFVCIGHAIRQRQM